MKSLVYPSYWTKAKIVSILMFEIISNHGQAPEYVSPQPS